MYDRKKKKFLKRYLLDIENLPTNENLERLQCEYGLFVTDDVQIEFSQIGKEYFKKQVLLGKNKKIVTFDGKITENEYYINFERCQYKMNYVQVRKQIEDGRIAIIKTFRKNKEKDKKVFATVEVEFDSLAEAEDFEAPKWFGKDITGYQKYQLKSISQKEMV